LALEPSEVPRGGISLDLLCGSVFVAHNAPFDLGALAAELEICRLSFIDDFVIDTLALTRLCYSFPSSLQSVAGYLGMDTSGQHRALWSGVHLLAVMRRTSSPYCAWKPYP